MRRAGKDPLRGLSPEERDVAERLVVLSDRVLKTWVGTLETYAEILPDGRELDASERFELRKRLGQVARAGVHLNVERELVDEAVGEVDLRSSRALLRTVRHSILLALSDDPETRGRAMSAKELAFAAKPAYDDWGHIMKGR